MWNVHGIFVNESILSTHAHMQICNVISMLICMKKEEKREHATSDNSHRKEEKNMRKKMNTSSHNSICYLGSYYHQKKYRNKYFICKYCLRNRNFIWFNLVYLRWSASCLPFHIYQSSGEPLWYVSIVGFFFTRICSL